MMTLRRFILSIVAVAASFAASAAPRITASVDTAAVEMGSFATLNINIADPSHSGVIVDLPEPATEMDVFDYVDVKTDTTPNGYTYTLRLQVWYPGMLTLPPFRYAIGDDTIASDIVAIKILPVEMDSTQTLNPMEGVVNPPRKWWDYIPDWTVWVALGLLLAALIGAGIYVYIVYRRTGTIIIHKPKPIDPYAEAMAALGRLRSRHLAESGMAKEYYTALIDILRRYLQQRFAINAMEMSSTQILASLRNNPETRSNQERIKQILDLADMVKFAKERPMPDDNITSFGIVEQFVEQTKPVPAPEETDKADNPTKKV